MAGKRRAVALLVALAIIAGAVGVYDAVTNGDREPVVVRVASDDAGAVVISPAGAALGRAQPGDAAVEFPAALADLPSPVDLAVDQATGDVWFMEFTYTEKNVLYRYSEREDKLESFPVPASKGSELYSAIAVDARGHVISAEGFVVLDFDPATETYKEYPLPRESTRRNQFYGEELFIADLALAAGGEFAYISRLDLPAITELNLKTGSVSEIELPLDFGQAEDIAVEDGMLWVASTSDIEGGPPAQTGRLDLASGEFTLVSGKTTALGSGAGNVYAVTGHPGSAVVSVNDSDLSPVVDTAEGGSAFASTLSGTTGHIVVDRQSGTVWATTEFASTVIRLEPSTGLVRTYQMPSYEGPYFSRCAEGLAEPCPTSTTVKTRVRGLAVGPNGDLWFSDGTRNRIGVIRADH